MSGPKIDEVELERRRQSELAAERSRNASILNAAISRIRSRLKTVKGRCLNIEGFSAEFIAELERVEEAACSSVISAAITGYPAEIGAAREFNDKLSEIIAKRIQALEGSLVPIVRRIDSAIAAQREAAKVEEYAEKFAAAPTGEYNYFSTETICSSRLALPGMGSPAC